MPLTADLTRLDTEHRHDPSYAVLVVLPVNLRWFEFERGKEVKSKTSSPVANQRCVVQEVPAVFDCGPESRGTPSRV